MVEGRIKDLYALHWEETFRLRILHRDATEALNILRAVDEAQVNEATLKEACSVIQTSNAAQRRGMYVMEHERRSWALAQICLNGTREMVPYNVGCDHHYWAMKQLCRGT